MSDDPDVIRTGGFCFDLQELDRDVKPFRARLRAPDTEWHLGDTVGEAIRGASTSAGYSDVLEALGAKWKAAVAEEGRRDG